MNKLLPLVLILFAAPSFAESYLCIGDKSVGFDNENNYQITKFVLGKYIIKSTEGDEFAKEDEKWAFRVHGKLSTQYCKNESIDEGLNEIFNDQPIICKYSNLGEFQMSIKTLRFINYENGGYVHGSDVDTISIEIGKCSKL